MKNNSQFHYSNFFSDTGIFTDLFNGQEFPWQTLPSIREFIDAFKNSDLSKNYKEISENVYVGKNVTIEDTARIKGSAIIGHNSTIGHAAFVRDGVLLGENVHIGHATEVKHSIVLSGSALAHLNYIGDSVVGSNVNISGGAILANWRFDGKSIMIKNGEERIQTNLEKMGSIIGDNSFIGVGSVLNPGTVLSKKCVIYPLTSVIGYHPEASVVKNTDSL